MQALAGKKIVVVGDSIGVGRAIALDQLEAEFPGVATMPRSCGLAQTILRHDAPWRDRQKGVPTPEDVAGAVVDFASCRQTAVRAYSAKADGVEALT